MSRNKTTWVRRELGPASYRFLRVLGVVALVIGVLFTGDGIYTGVKEHKTCSSVWESRREFVIEQNRCFLNAARSEQFGPISGPLSNDFPKLLGAYKAVSMDMVRCNHNPTHPDNRALCQSFSQARQSCTDRREIWAPIEQRASFRSPICMGYLYGDWIPLQRVYGPTPTLFSYVWQAVLGGLLWLAFGAVVWLVGRSGPWIIKQYDSPSPDER